MLKRHSDRSSTSFFFVLQVSQRQGSERGRQRGKYERNKALFTNCSGAFMLKNEIISTITAAVNKPTLRREQLRKPSGLKKQKHSSEFHSLNNKAPQKSTFYSYFGAKEFFFFCCLFNLHKDLFEIYTSLLLFFR